MSTASELTSRGVKLAREQKLAEAIDCFEQAIRLDPALALAHRNLGYARELLGQTAMASVAQLLCQRYFPEDRQADHETGGGTGYP